MTIVWLDVGDYMILYRLKVNKNTNSTKNDTTMPFGLRSCSSADCIVVRRSAQMAISRIIKLETDKERKQIGRREKIKKERIVVSN